MDLVKRNAEIVALVKARKMPMREIAARYRLSTSSISLITIRHGVHARAAEFEKGAGGQQADPTRDAIEACCPDRRP